MNVLFILYMYLHSLRKAELRIYKVLLIAAVNSQNGTEFLTNLPNLIQSIHEEL